MSILMDAILSKSPNPKKKWRVRFPKGHVNFGAVGYQNYTMHHDPARRQRYLTRHSKENWTNPRTAGFWARWLLWEEPTIEGAKKKITKRFGIRFH